MALVRSCFLVALLAPVTTLTTFYAVMRPQLELLPDGGYCKLQGKPAIELLTYEELLRKDEMEKKPMSLLYSRLHFE